MTRAQKADGWLKWAAAYWLTKRKDEAFRCLEAALPYLAHDD